MHEICVFGLRGKSSHGDLWRYAFAALAADGWRDVEGPAEPLGVWTVAVPPGWECSHAPPEDHSTLDGTIGGRPVRLPAQRVLDLARQGLDGFRVIAHAA